jgi:hypothetical protein
MAGPDVICVGTGKAAQEVLKVRERSLASVLFYLFYFNVFSLKFLFLCSALNERPLSVIRL